MSSDLEGVSFLANLKSVVLADLRALGILVNVFLVMPRKFFCVLGASKSWIFFSSMVLISSSDSCVF